MDDRKIGRRTFVQGASLAALNAAGVISIRSGQVQVAVPNSSGTEAPKLKAPALACDCHHHIYDTARWVKLSVGTSAWTYINVKDRPRTYADVNKVGQAYAQAAPERMVWGSN